MSVAFEPLFENDSVAVHRAENLVALRWRGVPNAASIRIFAPRIALLASRTPSLCMLSLTQGLPSLPDDETRAVTITFLRSLSSQIRAAAFAIEDRGFRAAAVRAVVTGLLAVVRPPAPVRVFGATDDAIRWLHPRLDMPGVSALAIAEALRSAVG